MKKIENSSVKGRSHSSALSRHTTLRLTCKDVGLTPKIILIEDTSEGPNF